MLSRALLVAARRQLANPRNVRLQSDVAAGLRPMQKTTPFERLILVWSHAFKSAKDVPEWISMMKMKRAYDVYRIEMYSAVIAFGALVFLGAATNEHHKHVVHMHEVDPQWPTSSKE